MLQLWLGACWAVRHAMDLAYPASKLDLAVFREIFHKAKICQKAFLILPPTGPQMKGTGSSRGS